jgi:integrase/recombinase XerD
MLKGIDLCCEALGRVRGENRPRRYDPPYGLFLINNPSIVPPAAEWSGSKQQPSGAAPMAFEPRPCRRPLSTRNRPSVLQRPRLTNDSQGEVGWSLCLLDSASKGKSGRMIPLSEEVREALIECRNEVNAIAGPYVISTERARQTSPQAIVNMFQRWYRHLSFVGCSSHSGRRTFITNAARKISTVGGSLRDVQMLAGHTNLRTPQRYIDANPDAQVKIVELV